MILKVFQNYDFAVVFK